MTAASMESCRFAARRSPRGRFWSVVDVRKRLHRVRYPFHKSIHITLREITRVFLKTRTIEICQIVAKVTSVDVPAANKAWNRNILLFGY